MGHEKEKRRESAGRGVKNAFTENRIGPRKEVMRVGNRHHNELGQRSKCQ